MLKKGDLVEGYGFRGRIAEVIGHVVVRVRWEDGAESEAGEAQLSKLYQTNRYNFVVFKNYDGTTEGKLIPRETYDRLMASGS